MHYKQAFWNCFLICKWNTHSCKRLNMNLPHSLQIQMRHGAVYVYIVCATARRGWRGVGRKHMKDTMKDPIVPLSMFTSKNEQLEPQLRLHTALVFISLFWTKGIDCRGWASLDMSFKTPMLSHCSIFIHLTVSNRPLGQHIVSLPVSSAVDGTYVADRDNMKPPASHPALSSQLSSSLLLLFSLPHFAIGCICDNSYIPVTAAWFSLAWYQWICYL